MYSSSASYVRYDNLRIRYVVAVLFLFGLISILSYFNELAKAGLLSNSKHKIAVISTEPPGHVIHKRSAKQPKLQHGEVHSLNIDFQYLRKISTGTKRNDSSGELHFALHMGKNQSYDLVQNSTVKVYDFQNVMPNVLLHCRHGNLSKQAFTDYESESTGTFNLNFDYDDLAKYTGSGNKSVNLNHKNCSNTDCASANITVCNMYNSSSVYFLCLVAVQNSDKQIKLLPFLEKMLRERNQKLNGSKTLQESSFNSSNDTSIHTHSTTSNMAHQGSDFQQSEDELLNERNNSRSYFPWNTGCGWQHQVHMTKRTAVFVYPHEVVSYGVRDCFRRIAGNQNLSIIPNPISQMYRNTWETLPAAEKEKFDVLYGGHGFGVCETMKKPCVFFTLLSDPLERLAQVYLLCRGTHNLSKALCSFKNNQSISVDLKTFIKKSGNSLFHKFLYYSRHCQLMGEDEICLHDSTANFILSAKERRAHLDHVIKHLPEWFSVIGLSSHLRKSLILFEYVTGLSFTRCLSRSSPLLFSKKREILQDMDIDRKVQTIVQTLRNDTDIQHWLKPDLSIYSAAEHLFKQQWIQFKSMSTVNDL